MKQKYTFFLKTNNSKIVLTDDSETLESTQEKISRFLNSKKITVFQTNSDLIFIDPSQISAIHISKIEEVTPKELHHTTSVKKINHKEEIPPSIIYDDEDDIDYNDDDDETLNDELISQIDDSSTLFSDLSEENSLYQTTDNKDTDDEIFKTEQILEEEALETEEI